MNIELCGIRRAFGPFLALDNVSLEVRPGELLALLGPSGSGKTTLLRVLAGLEAPDQGQVLYDGVEVTKRPVGERNVGFVFQHYALFPHLTVFENVAFALRVRHARESLVRERVGELLRLIRLENFAHRHPAQLSGGQRQRVALARALAPAPRVLLLDEPFGALDTQVRQELREWLHRLHKELEVTSVFVTHDQAEAFELADRVVITQKGRIEQVGTPDEVYENPKSAFVMDFLGSVNVLKGPALANVIPLHGGSAPEAAYVRHAELTLHRGRTAGSFPATVTRASRLGNAFKIGLDAGGEPLFAEVGAEPWAGLGLRPGDPVFVSARNVRVFPESGASAAQAATPQLAEKIPA